MKKSLLIILIFICAAGQLFAQVQVSGRVVDESGTPIPGANIVIKGTTQGTITDLDGNYFISKVPGDAFLVFSFMGMVTQEVAVGNRTIIDITLEEEAQDLEEVVVVGYGAVKRANLLGAVGSISADKIEDVPTQNLSTLLEGRIAGLRVGQSSGSPTATTNIKIRTTSTFTEMGESMLFVIDGVIYEDQSRFDALDPSEVESISVLKDASAAVYGARAAGGVIVVKTKRGKTGKVKVNYSSTYGYTDATKFPEMLTASEHAQLVNEGLRDYEEFLPGDNNIQQELYYTDKELDTFKTIDYNWMDEAWKPATLTRQNLSISGGSENVRYFGNFAYFKQEGNFENIYTSKFNLRVGLDADLTKDLSVSFTMSNNNSNKKDPLNAADQQTQNMDGTFMTLLEMPRYIPTYITTDDGEELPVYGSDYVSGHPLELFRLNSTKTSNSSNTGVNAALKYKIPFIKGLSINFSYDFDRSYGLSKQYRIAYDLYKFQPLDGYLHIYDNEVAEVRKVENESRMYAGGSTSKGYQFNSSIQYNREFGVHDVNALLVFEQAESEGNDITAYKDGMLISNYNDFDAFGGGAIGVSDGYDRDARRSFIGRLNYGYKDKYLLESTFRYEASSEFEKKNRWGFFPSVSVGWRISEEPFFKNNIHFIDHFKLRISTGLLGNDKVSSRQWEYRYNIQSAESVYLGGSSVVPTISPKNDGGIAKDFTWEKTRSFNAGFDVKFFNHFNLAYDYFYKHTYDILESRKATFPTTVGIEAKLAVNYGIMDAWGHEIDVGYNNKIGNNFRYHISGNIGFARAMVIRKSQNPAVRGKWSDEIGKMPNGEVGFTGAYIIRTEEEAAAINAMGYTIAGDSAEPGMMMYADVGGANYSNIPDGKIDANDRRIVERYANPPYTYGYSLGVSYKNLRFDANFSGSFGAKIYMEKEAFQLNNPGDEYDIAVIRDLQRNRLSLWKDHWTEDNKDAAYPRIFNNNAFEKSDFWLVDGHVLRLSTINFSYNLPQKFANRLKLDRLAMIFSAHNIWTIKNPFIYKDPSVSKFNTYPLVRTYNFTLNISL